MFKIDPYILIIYQIVLIMLRTSKIKNNKLKISILKNIRNIPKTI